MTRRRPQHPTALAPLAAALALVLPLWCGSAAAQNSPWFIGGSHSITKQDNVLELAIGQNPPPGFEKEDTVSTTSLLAGFDQRFGRQRRVGRRRVFGVDARAIGCLGHAALAAKRASRRSCCST